MDGERNLKAKIPDEPGEKNPDMSLVHAKPSHTGVFNLVSSEKKN